VFAFVVYYRQGTDPGSQQAVDAWSRELIDAALSVGGRYYLPYQPSATPAQFARAYPGVEKFRALKRQVDPANRFSNAFWQKYLTAEPPGREAGDRRN
jgi:FAD/FMN-containing dehydrogenase